MDIVNDLAAALTAAESAEDSLEASAGGDSAQTEALKNAIARFRALLDKNRETQAALEGELAQRTTAFTVSAQS
jgi:ribosomal protein S9